ncbi:hypothetical protein EON79_03950 [bacterium]|nr:MAG: hypothetical protein EON79_03950 [bacterium]
MFAGPNGSGKSTIKEVVPEPIRGTYINPDDLAKALTSAAGQDFGDFELDFDLQEFQSFVAASEFLTSKGTPTLARMLHLRKNALFYPPGGDVGYLASAISDFLRRKMLSERRWFSFETVMSSRDKVDLLREAQYQGYRTYLYYIATDDVRINLERVTARVIQNGHDALRRR